MKQFLYLILILMIVSACKEVFVEPPQALLQVKFLNSSTKLAITSKVTVLGIGRDSLWVDNTSIDEIMLPLSANDTTSFRISFDSQIDTISFIHETTQKYAAKESGFYYEFKLHAIDYTHNRIDSIQIIDSLVIQKWHENIKLYIRPLPVVSN